MGAGWGWGMGWERGGGGVGWGVARGAGCGEESVLKRHVQGVRRARRNVPTTVHVVAHEQVPVRQLAAVAEDER